MIRFGFILEEAGINLFPTPGSSWFLSSPFLTLAPGRWQSGDQWAGSAGCSPAPASPAQGVPPLGQQAGPGLWADLSLLRGGRPGLVLLGELTSFQGSVIIGTDPRQEATSSCQE